MFSRTQDLIDAVNSGVITEMEFFIELEEIGFQESAEWTWNHSGVSIALLGVRGGRFIFGATVSYVQTVCSLVEYLRASC